MLTVLITGANSGIGKATAISLAKGAHKIVLLCRNKKRGWQAKEDVITKSDNPNIDLYFCDLSSQQSIRDFVSQFKENYQSLDVLINNAGFIQMKRTVTEDGIESIFAVDCLATFYLTHLLQDLLKAAPQGRVVNVCGSLHAKGKINKDDLMYEEGFSAIKVGCQAVLGKVMLSYRFAEELEDSGVTVNCLHPGTIRSGFGRHLPWYLQPLNAVFNLFASSPEKGCKTVTYLAASKEVFSITGKYFIDNKEVPSAPQSYDKESMEWLWKECHKLCGSQSPSQTYF